MIDESTPILGTPVQRSNTDDPCLSMCKLIVRKTDYYRQDQLPARDRGTLASLSLGWFSNKTVHEVRIRCDGFYLRSKAKARTYVIRLYCRRDRVCRVNASFVGAATRHTCLTFTLRAGHDYRFPSCSGRGAKTRDRINSTLEPWSY